ncbi:MAG: hypothetical protein CL912_27515 [Deltaproteobacteria bacterium]|nr:hypothetical protein [Deltaproteobacteria bacterium]
MADWIGPNYLRLGFAWQGCQGSGQGARVWCTGGEKALGPLKALILDQNTLVSKGYYILGGERASCQVLVRKHGGISQGAAWEPGTERDHFLHARDGKS